MNRPLRGSQARVVSRGNHPDGCTTISQVVQRREGDTFFVTLVTERPADAMCIAVLTPFEETVLLDVKDLEPGRYTVVVNRVEAAFEIPSS